MKRIGDWLCRLLLAVCGHLSYEQSLKFVNLGRFIYKTFKVGDLYEYTPSVNGDAWED